MRLRLFGVLVIAASCSNPSVAVPPDETTTTSTATTVSTTTTSTTVSTTTTSTTTTTTVTIPDAPLGLVLDERETPVNGQTTGVLFTDTGWVVPILGRLPEGRHLVWTPCGRSQDVGGGDVVTSADFVLDPGHGGSEPGAVGPGGLREADLNLDVTRRLRDALVDAGYSVVMTRDADVRVPIVTRAEIAHALDPIAFLSIHFNAGTDASSETPGTEIYHQIVNPESKRLAGLIYEEAFSTLDTYDVDWVALGDAGTTFRPNRAGLDYYGVLRRPAPILSVLIEYAYLSNRAEEELLSDPDVQRELVASTVVAIERFLTTDDPGGGFIEDPMFRGYGPSGAGGTNNCTDPPLD